MVAKDVSIRINTRQRGSWKETEKITVPFDQAVEMVAASKGRNFYNTKPGDVVVTSISGNLSTIFAVKIAAGIEL